MPETLKFYRRHMPHWLVADRTYFVTIRQMGTIPSGVLQELVEERERLREQNAVSEEVLEMLRRQFVRIELILDTVHAGRGNLTDSGVAEVLLNNIAWLENPERGWNVYAAVVMSTHMHLVMRNEVGRSEELLADLGQYKNFTARESNRIMDRAGALWAREDFDHWCRTPEKVDGAVNYIKNNPVKAGLCANWVDWPWMMVKDEWKV